MTIYDLKPKFQALLRPSVNFLAQKGITPNQVTMFAMLLSILVGVIIALTQGAKMKSMEQEEKSWYFTWYCSQPLMMYFNTFGERALANERLSPKSAPTKQ